MYNRYLPEPAHAPEPPPQRGPDRGSGSGLGGLAQLLSGRLRTGNPDADTLIILAVIWFLLSDGTFVQSDLMVLVIVLFLLGL